MLGLFGLVVCRSAEMPDAGPMIPMCDDQEDTKARACPGYAPCQGLSQRSDRCPVAGDRGAAARRAARAAGKATDLAAAAGHRGNLVPGPDRVRLAVPACGLPALADRLRLLRRLAG